MATDLNSHVEDSNQGKTIHQEPGSEKPAQPSGTPFFKDLLSRRVPHILGGYLAGSWIIFEFVQWMVGHYTISPHLEEFCLIALASLIPTVFLLAYFHGKPGRDKWTRGEKSGIPTNHSEILTIEGQARAWDNALFIHPDQLKKLETAAFEDTFETENDF